MTFVCGDMYVLHHRHKGVMDRQQAPDSLPRKGHVMSERKIMTGTAEFRYSVRGITELMKIP